MSNEISFNFLNSYQMKETLLLEMVSSGSCSIVTVILIRHILESVKSTLIFILFIK